MLPHGRWSECCDAPPADSSTKCLALLREVIPNLRRLGFMGNTDNPPILLEMREAPSGHRRAAVECPLSGRHGGQPKTKPQCLLLTPSGLRPASWFFWADQLKLADVEQVRLIYINA